MKKTLAILFLASVVCFASQAQDYKPFQLYVGLGYAGASEGGGGVLLDLEPSYRIKDQLAVGLRMESASMGKDLGQGVKTEISQVSSLTVNGRYYFGSSDFRPYVGAGLGLYDFGTVEIDASGNTAESIEVGSEFGFYPRIGFDNGHFNFNIDYNIVGKSDGDIKNSYIGVRVAFFLFGGKK